MSDMALRRLAADAINTALAADRALRLLAVAAQQADMEAALGRHHLTGAELDALIELNHSLNPAARVANADLAAKRTLLRWSRPDDLTPCMARQHTSRFKGVMRMPSGKWRAKGYNPKIKLMKHLGYFEATPAGEQAAAAAVEAYGRRES